MNWFGLVMPINFFTWMGISRFWLIRFGWTALNRQFQLPIDPEQLRDVDYILISHDHRDYFHRNTFKILGSLLPDVKILAGLNMKPLTESWTPELEFQESSWFQNYNLSDFLQILFMPSRHWSRLSIIFQNEGLWGGFYIQSADKSIYFLGVGDFKSEWFMNPAHKSDGCFENF